MLCRGAKGFIAVGLAAKSERGKLPGWYEGKRKSMLYCLKMLFVILCVCVCFDRQFCVSCR